MLLMKRQMRTIKFRFRLKLICDNWGKYKKGDIDVFYITLESLCRFPIDEHWEILSQDEFTGLTDKNGVEIYEGDILTYKRSVGNWTGQFITTTHKIVFSDEVFAFVMKYGTSYIKLRKHWGYEYEIVGNIYQNEHFLNT